MSDDLAPLFLVEPVPPSPYWQLCLVEDESYEVFEAAGHSGNGYSWDAVGRRVAAELGLSDAIEFDSEAGTFVALGRDVEVLRVLGRALAALTRDPEALAQEIARVPEEDWDD